MSLDERKLRMNQLKKRERRMDVDAWVSNFMQAMDFLNGDKASSQDPHSDLIHGYKYLGVDFELTLGPYVEESSKLGVIVDFDGTLSYLAPVSYSILRPHLR